MHLRLGLTTGEIHASDSWSREDCERLIAEHDGRLGTKDYKHVRVESFEDTLAFMDCLFVRIMGDKDGEFTLEKNGVTMVFPANTVAWYRWVADD